MGIGDAITFVSCLTGFLVALAALLLFFNLVFPRWLSDAALRLQQGVILPFFVGLIPTLFIGIPSTILLSLGSVFQFCGTLAYLLLFLWAFMGLAAVSQTLGMRLGSLSGRPENWLLENFLGVVVLVFAVMFPILGWVIIFPLAMIIGVGATILALFNRLTGNATIADKRRDEEVN